MRRIWIMVALVALVAMPAAASGTTASGTTASGTTDVKTAIHQFINAFNRGDTKTAVADCTHATYIIDDFAPHVWHGAGACSRWLNDLDAYLRKNGMTDGKLILGTPRQLDVTGDRAYVVVPANYLFKQNGKRKSEKGSVLTIVLQKSQSGWHILAWAWAKH